MGRVTIVGFQKSRASVVASHNRLTMCAEPFLPLTAAEGPSRPGTIAWAPSAIDDDQNCE
jgi:hypothetical protein